jgi:hypothetical protein
MTVVLSRPDAGAAIADVDTGSASSRGRPPEQIWLVRLRRGDNSVIVAIGLYRAAAEHLAERINDLLAPTSSPQGPAVDACTGGDTLCTRTEKTCPSTRGSR